MTWERVFTVNGYYDGPRRGVANFRGKPHIYESQFCDIEENCADRFLLMEIEAALFQLVLEDWEIWLRWDAAFERGEVSLDSHPVLPEDRKRYEELQQLIGDRVYAVPGNCIVTGAEFRSISEGLNWFEVRWYEAGDDC